MMAGRSVLGCSVFEFVLDDVFGFTCSIAAKAPAKAACKGLEDRPDEIHETVLFNVWVGLGDLSEMTNATEIVAKLSDAKRSILRDAPEDWTLVVGFGWEDTAKMGGHLQWMFQRGLFDRKSEPTGQQRPQYRLTDLGRQCRAVLRCEPLESVVVTPLVGS